MPVTISIPNRHVSHWRQPKAESTANLLHREEARGCKKIIQSSYSIDGSLEENHVSASRNGLVWSSFCAYSDHHHLTIRSEDVWFAIVTQLSSYINSNAEKMREYVKYFSYGFGLACGIPSVTLLGEVADYEDILRRIDKLEEMGEEPTHFAKLLRPILQNMILSFTEPASPAVQTFWNQIADMSRMSGSQTMTGWITAFCYWDGNGKAHNSGEGCTLGGLSYPSVETSDIPSGFVTVPVKVNDNGVVHDCEMLSGSVGIQALPGLEGYIPAEEDVGREIHGAARQPPEAKYDEKKTGIKPVTGWMIYEYEEPRVYSWHHWGIERIKET
ncbi:hypothetical protein FBEOM_5862 [Fusarium beomiforme]|uniref:Uncharacterized protein n=1 Tax=Fusarium beomiforme TaxID=44412 RepID=A0A9P5DYI4_9HYPO|nr:hypothetical protein FBEOM_5862 [Fusarium beomiforme]